MSRRDQVGRETSERLCWFYSPVCLEWREETREEALLFRLLAQLVRRTKYALARRPG